MTLAFEPGPIIIVVIMLGAIPALLMSGVAVAAILGWVLRDEAVATHEGSELIDCNT